MAARRTARRPARRTTRRTTSSVTRSSGGNNLARYLLPVAALGIGAYLLWPKTANAALPPSPAPGPAPGPPNALPPPPRPSNVEPVADAPLTPGTSRGRITGSDVLVRSSYTDNAPVLSSLPLNAGVAVLIGPPGPATPNAPKGRLKVRTARGVEGYVATQYVRIDEQPGPGTAGYLYNRR